MLAHALLAFVQEGAREPSHPPDIESGGLSAPGLPTGY